MTDIAITYGRGGWLLTLVGMGPRFSGISVKRNKLRVRMGIGFRLKVPLSEVTSVEPVSEGVLKRYARGVGAHGWNDHWRVNGATRPIARITFAERQRARVLGIPVKVKTLDVSVADPAALASALGR